MTHPLCQRTRAVVRGDLSVALFSRLACARCGCGPNESKSPTARYAESEATGLCRITCTLEHGVYTTGMPQSQAPTAVELLTFVASVVESMLSVRSTEIVSLCYYTSEPVLFCGQQHSAASTKLILSPTIPICSTG